VRWYRKAAEQGEASAQYNLAISYDNGNGVREDKRKAVRWYRKAAEQGDADAQFNLGVAYANGDGIREDKRESVRWHRKAAEQGQAKAQYYLSKAYVSGVGIITDKREAYIWLTISNANGDEEAASVFRDVNWSDFFPNPKSAPPKKKPRNDWKKSTAAKRKVGKQLPFAIPANLVLGCWCGRYFARFPVISTFHNLINLEKNHVSVSNRLPAL